MKLGTILLSTLALAATDIAFSRVTTAGTSAAAETTEEKSEPTIGEQAAWPRLGEDETAGSPWTSVLVIFGVLGAAGASSVWLRKKHRVAGGDLIEVLASATVAPRMKVVLLGTRNREVLIGIGDKGPILLTEWLADSEPVSAAEAQPELHFEAPVDASPEPEALLEIAQPEARRAPPKRTPPTRSDSEAVAGLVALRKKAQNTPPKGQRVMKSKVATLDTDSEWATRLMSEMRAAGAK